LLYYTDLAAYDSRTILKNNNNLLDPYKGKFGKRGQANLEVDIKNNQNRLVSVETLNNIPSRIVHREHACLT